jgi:hypothetical protein
MGGERPVPWWAPYRVVVYALLGLLAVDALVGLSRHLWRINDPDDYRARLENCRRHPAELVLVGGSPVSEGIDPAWLVGLVWHGRPLVTAYNLGLPGATAVEIWHAVKHGLMQPPRLLVYGITATDLNDRRREPHGPASLMDVEDVAEMTAVQRATMFWYARHMAEDRLARLWNLYYFRRGIRLWAANCLERLWPGLCSAAAAEARAARGYSAAMRRPDGYAPNPGSFSRRYDLLKAAGPTDLPFDFLDGYRIGQHLAWVGRLLDWAAAHRVDVVLVDMPVSEDLELRRNPQAFACYRAALAGLERRGGLRVLRAKRDAVGLTDADFADLIHLNATGTARLSNWLRRELAGLK